MIAMESEEWDVVSVGQFGRVSLPQVKAPLGHYVLCHSVVTPYNQGREES